MKYFTRSIWMHPGQDMEVTPEKALRLYQKGNIEGFHTLSVAEDFAKGQHIYATSYRVWGEDITEQELFKRRLSGRLHSSSVQE